jgi:hypothetical protein
VLTFDFHFLQFAALFKDINLIKPSSPILPNLHTLRYNYLTHTPEEDYYLLMFMHKSIQIFSVYTGPRFSHSDVSAFLLDLMEAIQCRMPRLTSLDLSFEPTTNEQEFVQSATNLVRNLPLLNRVALPWFEDISPFLSITSRSSVLRSLKFGRSPTVVSSMQFQNPWAEGEVACLEELEIHGIPDSHMIIPLIPHLHHLRILRVTFTTGDIQSKSLFDALSQYCSALKELEVSYGEAQILEFDDLGGILACRNITRLILSPINLSDAEITRMALAWPQMERLYFNGLRVEQIPEALRPLSIRKKTSIWAVFVLTRLCPNLKELMLSINTAPRDTPPKFDISSLPPGFQRTKQEAHLELMAFGFPLMILESGDEYVLSELLGKILPAQCKLYYNLRSFQGILFEVQNRKWVAVDNLFPRFAELYSTINRLQNIVDTHM